MGTGDVDGVVETDETFVAQSFKGHHKKSGFLMPRHSRKRGENMKAYWKEKGKVTLIDVLGLIGAFLWALTIFLRETALMHNEFISFLLGIAPNFGVALLLPMFAVIYYPILFKKHITFKKFILILIAIFLLLIVSEVVHAKFLDSRFDFYDMIASLIALGVMILSYKYKHKKISN
jgi:hypothetical protein